jgi:hypothetical protein
MNWRMRRLKTYERRPLHWHICVSESDDYYKTACGFRYSLEGSAGTENPVSVTCSRCVKANSIGRRQIKRREIWSTCYWCRENFCTVRRMLEQKCREPRKFCSKRCENMSRRWDAIAIAGGLTRSKYPSSLPASLLAYYPCGHERSKENTHTHAGKGRCIACRRRRAAIYQQKRKEAKVKMKEAA